MVFNYKTYPKLAGLYEQFGLSGQKSNMSWSFQNRAENFSFSGKSLHTLFSSGKSVFSSKRWRFLQEVTRFNRTVRKLFLPEGTSAEEQRLALSRNLDEQTTIAAYLQNDGYSYFFLQNYIYPMIAAVWSVPIDSVASFPALRVLRFFSQHEFVSLQKKIIWYSVKGGSDMLLEALIRQECFDRICSPCLEVRLAQEDEDQVAVKINRGQGWERLEFDKVIVGTPAPQALEILENPNGKQKAVLSAVQYYQNTAFLHTEKKLMPQSRRLWASWNFSLLAKPFANKGATFANSEATPENGNENRSEMQAGAGAEKRTEKRETPYQLTYYLNWLQNISGSKDFFLTLGSRQNIPKEKIIKEFQAQHLVFSVPLIKAQQQWRDLHTDRIFFVGSHFRNGFHEDAIASVYDLKEHAANL